MVVASRASAPSHESDIRQVQVVIESQKRRGKKSTQPSLDREGEGQLGLF
jgi:hypothetical protein